MEGKEAIKDVSQLYIYILSIFLFVFRETSKFVSLGGVSWLTADFPLLGRTFLILLVWCFPAYPGRSIFPNLRASQSAMEIDEGVDVGLTAASQSGRPQEFYCPIQGCARSCGQGPAWTSKDALRAHLDMHFLANFKVDPRMRFFRIWACAAVAFAAKVLVKDILREFIPRVGRKLGILLETAFLSP